MAMGAIPPAVEGVNIHRQTLDKNNQFMEQRKLNALDPDYFHKDQSHVREMLAEFEKGDKVDFKKLTDLKNTDPVAEDKQKSAFSRISNYQNLFLKMLMAQLRYQIPGQEQNTNEMIGQFATFAGVEQQLEANKKLEALVQAQDGSNIKHLIPYLGHEVECLNNQFYLKEDGATLSYKTLRNTDDVNVIIQDQSGHNVQKIKGDTAPGWHEFKWDGKDEQGHSLKEGIYTIKVSGRNSEDKQKFFRPFETKIKGVVTGLTSQGDVNLLKIGDLKLTKEQVLNINLDPERMSERGAQGLASLNQIEEPLGRQNEIDQFQFIRQMIKKH